MKLKIKLALVKKYLAFLIFSVKIGEISSTNFCEMSFAAAQFAKIMDLRLPNLATRRQFHVVPGQRLDLAPNRQIQKCLPDYLDSSQYHQNLQVQQFSIICIRLYHQFNIHHFFHSNNVSKWTDC